MNTLDIIVAVVLVLSAGFAYMRGFVRELLAIVAWVGAAFITFYGYSYVAPFAERFVPKGPIANISAGAVVFIVALIVLSIITGAVSKQVAQSGMSSVDRLFGLLFGLARGAVLVALGYIALAWYLPPDKPRPPWVMEARTLPLLQAGANMLESLVPAKWREQFKATATRTGQTGALDDADAAARALMSPKTTAKPADTQPAYRQEDRADMDRLINQQQGHQQ
jgi:membrane protein required for colicin V production